MYTHLYVYLEDLPLKTKLYIHRQNIFNSFYVTIYLVRISLLHVCINSEAAYPSCVFSGNFTSFQIEEICVFSQKHSFHFRLWYFVYDGCILEKP